MVDNHAGKVPIFIIRDSRSRCDPDDSVEGRRNLCGWRTRRP